MRQLHSIGNTIDSVCRLTQAHQACISFIVDQLAGRVGVAEGVNKKLKIIT